MTLVQLTLLSLVFATLLWWFSTGVIFFLNARPAHTFRWSLLGASIVALIALLGLWHSARSLSVVSVFVSFGCGLVVWGWHTMSYYMGMITGPQREPCPDHCKGLMRFLRAAATSFHHELAILATAGLIVGLTWNQPNLLGLWTFLLLWGMHLSAKLNVFLGVRNLNIEFIPQRLSYLTSYFRQASMNLLFPVSVTVGTVLTVMFVHSAIDASSDLARAAGYLLLAALAGLAVIEHWFMMLPVRAEALWSWSLKQPPEPDKGETDSERHQSVQHPAVEPRA